MPPPDDTAPRLRLPIPLHSVPKKDTPDGISDKDLREHVAQTAAKLVVLVESHNDLLGAVADLTKAVEDQGKRIQANTAAVGNLEITVNRNGEATAQRIDALAKAVVLAAQIGKERDEKIEQRAAEASSKASGVRQAIVLERKARESHQNLEKERLEAERLAEAQRQRAEEIARAIEAERDRRRDEEIEKIRRRQDLNDALREAEEAKYDDAIVAGREEREAKAKKDIGPQAIVSSIVTSGATAIVSAINGQSIKFVIFVSLGVAAFAAFFVLVVWFIRKAKP